MNAAFQKLCAMLTAAGVPDARFDAAELYRFATGRDPRLDDVLPPSVRIFPTFSPRRTRTP